jgi:nucleotide-binding universal stress UspA family protein
MSPGVEPPPECGGMAAEAVTPGIQGEAKGRPYLQEPEAIGKETCSKRFCGPPTGQPQPNELYPWQRASRRRTARIQASGVPLAATAAIATAQKSADATEEALRRKVEDLKRDGVTVEFASTEITTGGPAYAITQFARDTGADLIVVGTSGSSQLVRLLVGSVNSRANALAARGSVSSSDRRSLTNHRMSGRHHERARVVGRHKPLSCADRPGERRPLVDMRGDGAQLPAHRSPGKGRSVVHPSTPRS